MAEFPEGTHGDGADNIVGAAENGSGDLIGVCPNCSVLEIRVSDAVIADINLIGAAVDYAHDMGAKVISIAMGSFNYSDAAHRSILDAYADGVLTIAAGGDEMGIHHLWPAAGEDVINVTALFPFPPVHLFDFVPIELIAFTESYCTNFGAHTDVSVPAGHICTSEATNNTSGVAALIVSRARDVGIEPSANELKQLMTISADDIYERCVSLVEGPSMGGVCRKGWDQHFGYGRLNAKRAFDMLGYPEEGIDPAVPPEARITDPIWWRTYDPSVTPTVDVFGQMSSRAGSYRWELQGALGVQPFNGDFRVLASGDESSPVDGFIATADISGLMDESDWSRPPDNAVDKVATLRLRVWSDEPGGEAMGEARKALRLHRDDDPETGLIPGFPLALGMSVESSPRLYDMDGDPDGRLEIVFATSLGTVEVLKYDDGKGTWENAPGFPVDVSGEDPRYAEGVISAVAVGDVFGDGLPKIVAATLGCTVYLIHHDGENHDGGAIVDGFPVRVDEPGNDSSFEFGHGNAILASPVLADLDRDGLLDIVVGASDQFVYAWSPLDENDDGEADRMSGWPILLSSAPGLVPGWKKCTDALPAQILGTPAVGILDPDHENPDIALHPAVIVPVTETCNDGVVPTSRVYAVYWNGTDNSLGPYLPGWPAVITTPLGDAIPVPPLTAGATNSPAVWIDDNGTARVSAGSFFWLPQMIAWDGMETVVASYGGHANFTSTTNGTFAKFRGDDSMQFLLPTLGALNLIDGVVKLESWNILGWDVDNYRDSVFRERWEDFMAFLNPIVADISGDNLPEVIAGSGGYNVHAFDIRGREPETWPKATHNWAIASAAVGDIDRDGKLEVVQAMHEGDIFAWNTKGRECKKGEANSDWRGFHHDERGTGFYGADTLPPAMVTELFHMDEGGGRFTLTFAAPGDELGCGTVTGYDVRYATSAGADLRPLDAFNAAAEATVLSAAEDFLTGGNKQRLTVEAPEDARVFALRAYDDFGHLAWPSVASTEGEPESDDDDIDDDDFADDDDTTADDDGDDDDDDDGCGC
ncbi:MAG: S8 family serine peptidase [Deltaproteobacteria bacterium]|nr:S8 family serine peptidase [Deltaproteobacteria bacterium]